MTNKTKKKTPKKQEIPKHDKEFFQYIKVKGKKRKQKVQKQKQIKITKETKK